MNYTKGMGGGGGGYTATAKNQSVSGQVEVVIGAGGTAGSTPTNGGNTTFGSLLTASGGYSGPYDTATSTVANTGRNGGSGGGGGRYSDKAFDNNGGSDGGNGAPGAANAYNAKGGDGQGSTTREFGEPDGKLYAGGGGGGTYFYQETPVYAIGGAGGGGAGAWDGAAYGTQAAGSGDVNTGGGGGGGAYGGITKGEPGNGGSGIVCLRVAAPLPELAGTWTLNERLYAPKKSFYESISFTVNGSPTTSVSADLTDLRVTFATGTTTAIYAFAQNQWYYSDKKIWVFPTGATASDNFRAWLASNAAKQ